MPPPTHDDALIGQVVDGRYRIRGVLGRGGMGVVYEAEAIRLGKRPCAIKVLLPEFTRNDTVVARFSREAEVAARVKHANVVEIFDTGTTSSGLGYIAMELLRGESLDRTLKRDGPLPWPRAQHVLLQICRALTVAHAQGVIHRDIKPENCFRSTVENDHDFIKVLDFGIAKLADADADADTPRLTATNSMIGTYAYMSYEQICGEPNIDHRVDIWATGVILYEVLTGRRPFRGNNQNQVWIAISRDDPEPLRDIAPYARIPEAVDAIILQALAKDRDKRFPTIEDFARALSSVTANGLPTRGITAKLTHPTLVPQPGAVDIRAETVLVDINVDDHLDERPTRDISPHGLTELVPEELKPNTHETVHSVVSASTHPDRDAVPPPPREAMQTAIVPILRADVAVALPPPWAAFFRNRRALLLIFPSITATAALVLFLTQFTEPEPQISETTNGMIVASPTLPAIPVATADAPPFSSPLREPGPPAREPVKPDPTTETKVAEPLEIKKALRTESFHDKVAADIRRFRTSSGVKKCFADFQPGASLEVKIEVSVAGVATIHVPDFRVGTPLADCLVGALKNSRFSKGNASDTAYPPKPITLAAK